MAKKLYVDTISWKSFFAIASSKSKLIYEIDSEEKGSNFYRKLTRILGKKIIFLDFFAGELYNEDSIEPVYIRARKEGNKLAYKWSKKIVENNHLISKVNSDYGNNTLLLHLSKFLQVNVFEWTLKILAFKSITSESKDSEILIEAPKFFCGESLKEEYPRVKINFYNKKLSHILGLIFLLFKELYLRLKSNFSINISNKKEIENFRSRKSVLSFQEESIRKEQSLRGQLHWLDFSLKNRLYDVHIISLPSQTSIKIDDINKLRENNIFIHNKRIFRLSRNNKNNPNFKIFKDDIKKLWKLFFKKEALDNIYNLKTIFLMYMAIDLASICLYLKTKVFVIKEPYFIYSDAIQLLSNKIGVKTIAYQYSNLGYFSPLMVSSSDLFLTFSSAYNKLFKIDGYGPIKIKSMGYVNEGIENRFSKRVFDLNCKLKSKGVKFTIAYFDESIQKDRWGLIKEDDFKQHILILSEKVILDTTLAVLIKSQFIYNLIQKKFDSNPVIKKAYDTGRLIEVYEGEKRNDIYPMEIANNANICINHLIGATAGLEAAITGTRCILINEHNYKSIHQDIYEKENIIYSDFTHAINAIYVHRNNLKKKNDSNLGDWTNCLNYFIGESKKRGIDKIKSEVENLIHCK
tara:strand:+ start:10349 stop:12247 length:1899 start_codon:yes stop_codon:yes gene_type:complete